MQSGRPGTAPPDVATLMREAEQALDHNEYQTAIDRLRPVVATAPDSVAAWFDLGYACSGLHQNDEARKAYERAVSLDPSLFEARLNLGVLLLEMNQAQAALPHLQKAELLQPTNARAHLSLGRALAATGQAALAGPEFREALRLDPKLAPAAAALGQLELGEKEYTEAADDFEKALALDPGLAEAELGLAFAREGLSQQAEAEMHFELYLLLRPADREVRFHLARLYLQENKPDQALTELEPLEQEQAPIPGLAAAAGDAYALEGKFADSERSYRQALAATPAEAGLHRALAETLLKEGKTGNAEAEFHQALRLDPRNAEALKGLASSLYLEKRYVDAAPLVERLITPSSAPPGLFFILATCYDHLRDRRRALDAYQSFLERSRGSSPDQEWQARQRIRVLRRELEKPL